jgi:hypothetical protein
MIVVSILHRHCGEMNALTFNRYSCLITFRIIFVVVRLVEPAPYSIFTAISQPPDKNGIGGIGGIGGTHHNI